ncbi:hypothetical protein [Streptomyces sp. CMB-StM0423]|uniref:hypothetical protein n=1 Tax=Streptomyces sp. CMB-StM0423 TaxID=2059884 RepID=UPI000C6FD983|nr:hypothetical protein [Streptomyces sp. CMB-StM0423]AUH41193.1 hypothetical protein CXR04_13885 [Streptomyces sp. CMB-StM0423]
MATTTDGTPPATPDEPVHRLRTEVERLRQDATRQRKLAHRRAEFWARTDIALGFPAALLAAVSGAAALASADARVPAALGTLVSAGFAAGAAFLRSERRRLANKWSRQAWAAVEARATVLLAQDGIGAADLAGLFELRQTALAAYDGDENPRPPGPPPPAASGPG